MEKVNKAKTDLKIEWPELQAALNFDEVNEVNAKPAYEYVGPDGKRSLKFLLDEQLIPSAEDTLNLRSYKNIREGGNDSFSVELKKKKNILLKFMRHKQVQVLGI